MKEGGICLVFSIFLFTFFSVFGCDVYVTSCQVLNSANTYYCLSSDIIDSSSSVCFDITADNITFDLQGHIVDGTDYSDRQGIRIKANDTLVKNGILSEWWAGVRVYSGGSNIQNIRIEDLTFNYSQNGVYVSTADNSYINNIRCVNETGICLYFTTDIHISSYWTVSNIYADVVWSGIRDRIIGSNFENITIITDDSIDQALLILSSNNTFRNCTVINGYVVDYDSYQIGNFYYDLVTPKFRYGAYNSIINDGHVGYYEYRQYAQEGYFNNTNFTDQRTIEFMHANIYFNYVNGTNNWINTSSANPERTINRRLIGSWNNTFRKWNDTGTTTLNYRIGGLKPDTLFVVYNNGNQAYKLLTDESGKLQDFSIALNGQHEIEINEYTIAGCDYIVTDCSVLSVANKVYCLDNDIIDSANTTCMNFTASNVTLDCMGHIIDGTSTDGTYGIYSNQDTTKIYNCFINSWDRAIQLENVNPAGFINNTVLNDSTNYNIFGSDAYALYITNTTINCRSDKNGYQQGGSGGSSVTVDSTFNNCKYGLYLINSYGDDAYGNRFIDGTDFAIFFSEGTPSGGNYYNNFFNQTKYFGWGEEGYVYLNTTLKSGTRVYGSGDLIGGNYYTNSTNNGFSDTCLDSNADGICNSNYTISTSVDYLPLSDEYGKSVLSITFNYATVSFGSLISGTNNNPAINQMSGVYNVTMFAQGSSGYTNVMANATDLVCSITNITVSNLKMDTNTTAGNLAVGSAKTLSGLEQLIDVINNENTINYHGYWLSVPAYQYADSYSGNVTVTYVLG